LVFLDNQQVVALDGLHHREVDERQDVLSSFLDDRDIRRVQQLDEVVEVGKEAIEHELWEFQLFLLGLVGVDGVILRRVLERSCFS